MFRVPLIRMCILLLLDGVFCRYLLILCGLTCHFRLMFSYVFSGLSDVPTDVRGVLKFSTVIVFTNVTDSFRIVPFIIM